MDEEGRCNSEASSSSLHDADSSILTEPAVCNSSLSTSTDSHVGDYENSESSGKENVSLQQDLGLDRQQLEGTQIIAKGIASVVGPVIRDFDSRAEGALKSQGVLKSSIDRLTRELDTLLEDAPLPFITQHATKLSGVRKRVSSLSSTLQTIQKRIDNIERMLLRQGLENAASSGKDNPTMPHNSSQHIEHKDVDARKT